MDQLVSPYHPRLARLCLSDRQSCPSGGTGVKKGGEITVIEDVSVVGLELLPLTLLEVRRLLVRLLWNDVPSQIYILAWLR